MSTVSFLDRRIAREIASRKEAERLLETKSEELYAKNQQLHESSRQLTRALELLRSLMGVVPEILIACNEQFIIQMITDASINILGYEHSDLVGSHICELFPELEQEDIKFDAGTFMLPAAHMRRADGKYFSVNVTATKINVEAEVLLIFVIRSHLAKKAADHLRDDVYWQLHEAKRLESIGTLASGLAHELNTPMQFIGDNITFISRSLKKIHNSYLQYEELRKTCYESCMFSEVVKRIDDFNTEIDLANLTVDIFQAMRETRDGIAQVRNIVRSMREFAHPGTGIPECADINQVVQSALTICRSRSRNIAVIDVEFAPDLPKVECRASQIQQVIVNIVVNAIEAIEEEQVANGRISISTEVVDEYMRIAICNNGPKISDKLKERIFNPFFTTKRIGKGTGQGLALAKDIIVTQHGGRLALGEKPGFTTAFLIDLPLTPPASTTLTQRLQQRPQPEGDDIGALVRMLGHDQT